VKRICDVISRCGALLIAGALTVACDSAQLPDDAILSLSPKDKTIVISAENAEDGVVCISADYPYIDVPYVFSIRNAQGSPLSDVPVKFYADWTEQSIGANEGLLLMFDFNGDGVTDPETETVSNINDGLFERKTNQYSGDVQVTLRLNLSCPYHGEFVAIVGGHHTSAQFTVELDSLTDPTPELEKPFASGKYISVITRYLDSEECFSEVNFLTSMRYCLKVAHQCMVLVYLEY